MRQLAEELYERTKDMISDIAVDLIKDHLLTSTLNEYYTLWNNPVKLSHDIDSAMKLIERVEKENAETLHNIKLASSSRLSIVVLYRSTLAYIFYKHWGITQNRIANLLNRDRTSVTYMVSSTANNIWYYNKQECFERRVIKYLFEEAGVKDPFD